MSSPLLLRSTTSVAWADVAPELTGALTGWTPGCKVGRTGPTPAGEGVAKATGVVRGAAADPERSPMAHDQNCCGLAVAWDGAARDSRSAAMPKYPPTASGSTTSTACHHAKPLIRCLPCLPALIHVPWSRPAPRSRQISTIQVLLSGCARLGDVPPPSRGTGPCPACPGLRSVGLPEG